jgi:hypothetical protein
VSVGIGSSLRAGGRHPFYVIKSGTAALAPDLAESDSGVPTFSGAAGGWTCNVTNSNHPRGLFNTGTPDVEIRVACDRSDGSAIYFRRESTTRMWRLSFGDYISSTTTIPGHHSPAVASSCTLSGFVSHEQKNFCECANIYTGHTVYSGDNPSYDYQNFWGGSGFSAACGRACSTLDYPGDGCTHECLTHTRKAFYTCTGGHGAAHSPGGTVNNYSTRWTLQYRNGSTTWTNVAQVDRSVGDMRILARGTQVQVFFGTLSTNSWTLHSTYTDNFTGLGATYHGVGSANTSVRDTSLNGGLNSIWIETL